MLSFHPSALRPSLAALCLVLLLTACGPAPAPTAAPTTPATATAAPTDIPLPAPSATPQPTATATATATATFTATATPTAAPTFGPAEDGLSAWCLPAGELVSLAADPLSPPANALYGEMVAGALEIRKLPFSACVFLYTFNQPPPDGLTLEVYELNQKAPWLKAELLPVEGRPGALSALLRHTYIIEPPLWSVSYEFAVRDAAGTELRRDRVDLSRWTPVLCWNGQPPNPITLRCPLAQDLHPWDAGYGTPIPTFPPEED